MTARQRAYADSMSLNAIATPAPLEPGPLVIRCRSRTVAKVDSIGLVVLMEPADGQLPREVRDGKWPRGLRRVDRARTTCMSGSVDAIRFCTNVRF